MNKREYNLNLYLSIAVGVILLTIILGVLQKQYGIFGPANLAAIKVVKSMISFPLTLVMTAITWFGEAMGLMIFICVFFWLGFATEIVVFMLMVIFGGAISEHMKEFFAMHRPLPAETTIIGKAKGFGYPSGHSQSGVYYSWLMYAFIGKYWPLCLIPAALLVFSRIYLGVHYFSDTVGGVLLGVGVVAGAMAIYSQIQSRASQVQAQSASLVKRLVFSFALSVLYLLVAWKQPDSSKYGGFLAGFFIIYLGLGFRWKPRNPFFAVIAILLGLVVLLALQAAPLMLGLPRNFLVGYISYFIQGLILAISPLLFVKIGLMKKVEAEVEEVPAKEVEQTTGV